MPVALNRHVIKPRFSEMTAVGSYIFAGGFTVGVEQAGFRILRVMEEGPYGVATFRYNRPNIPVQVGPENWTLRQAESQPIDFVYGNPPCAAWSNAGAATKKGRTWDSSALVDCTRHHFETLIKLRPKVWAWESVQRAWTLGRSLVDEFAIRAAEAGYSTTILLHDAQWLGVPQIRKRFFMVCHRVELEFADPVWKNETIESALARVKVRGEPLERNLGKHRAILSRVNPGENLSSAWMRLTPKDKQVIGVRGQMVGRPPFTIKRARAGQPAPVVMHELIHPTEARGLSLRELATLCGYPQDYVFVDAKDAGQIGRGVCPPVAKYLAINVAEAVTRNIAVETPVYRLVDFTKPPGHGETLSYEEPYEVGEIEEEDDDDDDDQLDKTCAADEWPEAEIEDEAEDVAEQFDREMQRKREDGHVPQRQATRQGIDPDRKFDKTSLRANAHGKWVHRDYGAHFFRWGFAGRFVTSVTDILDVGCGPDIPMIDVLTMPRSQVPRRYVGVDMNKEPRKHPTRQWATMMWEFDFIARFKELGKFDVITNFEVIEHMKKADGSRLLMAMRDCLRTSDSRILLSTPVFNGKAAANHIHEWTVDELKTAINGCGLEVVNRFGTFASWNEIRKVCTETERKLLDEVGKFYGGEVLSCFLAPKYPDASRNNTWVLKRI